MICCVQEYLVSYKLQRVCNISLYVNRRHPVKTWLSVFNAQQKVLYVWSRDRNRRLVPTIDCCRLASQSCPAPKQDSLSTTVIVISVRLLRWFHKFLTSVTVIARRLFVNSRSTVYISQRKVLVGFFLARWVSREKKGLLRPSYLQRVFSTNDISHIPKLQTLKSIKYGHTNVFWERHWYVC